MYHNSYFMTDTCIELFADALGFSAEDVISAAEPLRTVHAECRKFTNRVCLPFCVLKLKS